MYRLLRDQGRTEYLSNSLTPKHRAQTYLAEKRPMGVTVACQCAPLHNQDERGSEEVVRCSMVTRLSFPTTGSISSSATNPRPDESMSLSLPASENHKPVQSKEEAGSKLAHFPSLLRMECIIVSIHLDTQT